MDKRRLIKNFAVIISIFVIVFGVGLFLMTKSTLLAEGDTLDKSATIKFSQKIDGKNINFKVSRYFSSASANESKILISEQAGLKKHDLLLENAGSDFRLCSDQHMIMKNNDDLICFLSETGVHAETLYMVKYQKEGLSLQKIYLNGEETFIFSDVPNFIFDDYDNDGFVDIMADMRDYDTNPLEQTIRYYYRNSENGFTFDKSAKL